MTENTFKYDFFISYRHGEPDTQIAQYLQRALEHYKFRKRSGKNPGSRKSTVSFVITRSSLPLLTLQVKSGSSCALLNF